MTEFGPNKTRRQYFCLKLTVLLLLTALLAFVTATILILSQRGVLKSVRENGAKISDSEDALLSSRFSSQNCSDSTARMDHGDSYDFVIVPTNLGDVEGRKKKVFNATVNVFLGIPYATPPVGELRFKRTVQVKPWKKTLQATSYAPNCVQYYDPRVLKLFTLTTQVFSEDCLYLNIWTPSNVTELKPVMVYIHGGGFSEGSSNAEELQGDILASYGDLIVVNFNYRLGSLGFLDLGIEDSPGNQGLYDQAMALRWVKENIANFGGDPEQVTVFGQSAGAISIGLHMGSPVSKYLFKRAILQSGSPMVVSDYFSKTSAVAQRVAELTGCVSTPVASVENDDGNVNVHKNPDEVLRCLMQQPESHFITASKTIVLNGSLAFTPSPYEDFLPIMPSDAAKEGTFSENFTSLHEVLVGVNNDEASAYLHLHDSNIFSNFNVTVNFTSLDEVKEVFVNIMRSRNVKTREALVLASTFLKAPLNASSDEYVKVLHTGLSDIAFNCPAVVLAEELSKANKSVYFYVFNHKPNGYSELADWMGVPHISELPFIFGYQLRYPTRFPGVDIDVSKRMMSTWIQFAKTGKLPHPWQRFTGENHEYNEIKSSNHFVGHYFHEKACNLYKIGFDSSRR